MKKIIVISLFISFFAQAEPFGKKFGSKITFDKGTVIVNGAVGLFSPYYLTGSSMTIPPIILGAEYGITPKIGIGVSVGFTGSTYKFSDIYRLEYTYIVPQVRGAYHFINRDKLDIYAGLSVGYSIVNYQYVVLASSTITDPNVGRSLGGFAPGIFIGGRYYLTNQLAIFAEAGYNISFISLGVTFRIQ